MIKDDDDDRKMESSEENMAVQVAVRIRPLNTDELSEMPNECVKGISSTQIMMGGDSTKQFAFDHVLPQSASQTAVYNTVVQPLMDKFFDGYNITVFAYGQTGSGKTFTMGNEFRVSVKTGSEGIIPRVMQDVFSRADSSCVFSISYLEILNEEIRDLLAPNGTNLPIREDGKRGVFVSGLTTQTVDSYQQVFDILHAGALNRATASTNMNATSSRSHAICTLTMQHNATSSKFHLVDLAGSERAKKTKAEGARFKEGVNINKGLLALGNVISALTEERGHVPYRDSKITRLLQDSLGGNSFTVMIACVSPADTNFDETQNTLRYANRARQIQNCAVINQDTELIYLRQQVQVLQAQLVQGQNARYEMELAAKERQIGLLKERLQNFVSEEELIEYDEESEEDNESLNELDEAIHEKEKILHALTDCGHNLQAQYEAKISSLEMRIEQLDKQKRALLTQKHVNAEKPAQLLQMKEQLKLAKRELKKAKSYKKEYLHLSKLKKRGEMRVSSLESELQTMKQQRTALQRKTRQETDMHRKEKRAKELEIIKLKRQEQKKEYRLTKLTAEHTKQQNVLKRKTEEVATIQQRLRTMQMQSATSSYHQTISEKKLEQQIENKVSAMQTKTILTSEITALKSLLKETPQNVAKINEKKLHIGQLRQQLVALERTYSVAMKSLVLQKNVESIFEYFITQIGNERMDKHVQTKEIQRLELQTKRKNAKKEKSVIYISDEEIDVWEEVYQEEDGIGDDDSDDSDYINTPMKKRPTKTKRQSTESTQSTEDTILTEIDGLLISCECSGKCATKACTCKLYGIECSPACKCKIGKCVNQVDDGKENEKENV